MMDQAIGAGLRDAMLRGMREFRRSSDDATRHALAAMARSAGPRTAKAPARREVFDNPHFAHLLRTPQYGRYDHDKARYPRYFKFGAYRYAQGISLSAAGVAGVNQRFIYGNDRRKLARIANRGLAQRSWRWAAAKALGGSDPREIPGTMETYFATGRDVAGNGEIVVGRALENRLSYIVAAMSANWSNEVAAAATNWMMRNLMERQARSMGYTMERARAA